MSSPVEKLILGVLSLRLQLNRNPTNEQNEVGEDRDDEGCRFEVLGKHVVFYWFKCCCLCGGFHDFILSHLCFFVNNLRKLSLFNCCQHLQNRAERAEDRPMAARLSGLTLERNLDESDILRQLAPNRLVIDHQRPLLTHLSA